MLKYLQIFIKISKSKNYYLLDNEDIKLQKSGNNVIILCNIVMPRHFYNYNSYKKMLENYSTTNKLAANLKLQLIAKRSVALAFMITTSASSFAQGAKGNLQQSAQNSITGEMQAMNNAIIESEYKTKLEENTWTLVTNSYSFAISAEQVIDKNKSRISPTIYIPSLTNNQKSEIDYAQGYTMFNLSGGTTSVGSVDINNPAVNFDKNSAYGIINSQQKFLVQPLQADDLVISNTMETQAHRDDVLWGGKEPKARNRYWMNLTNAAGNYSQTLMGYFKDATDDIDPGFDGSVYHGAHVTLYSFCNGVKLSIQGQAMPLTNNKYVVFGYNTKAAGMLNLYIPQTELDFNGTMPLLLKDSHLGGFYMIKDAPYYFYSAAGTFDDRFEIHYTDGSNRLAGDKDTMEDKVIMAYKEGDNIVVKANNGLYTEIEIYDMNAKVVKAVRNINTDFTIIEGVQQQNQLLLINVKTTEGKYITKKIIF